MFLYVLIFTYEKYSSMSVKNELIVTDEVIMNKILIVKGTKTMLVSVLNGDRAFI